MGSEGFEPSPNGSKPLMLPNYTKTPQVVGLLCAAQRPLVLETNMLLLHHNPITGGDERSCTLISLLRRQVFYLLNYVSLFAIIYICSLLLNAASLIRTETIHLNRVAHYHYAKAALDYWWGVSDSN